MPFLPLSALTKPFTGTQQAAQTDVLVCVFLRGAMDGLNAVIPYADDGYYKLRSSIAVAAPKPGKDETAINLDGFFGLHPALRPLKASWDAGTLALVHASGSPDPTHSHFEAWDYMEAGTPGEKRASSGWLSRHLQQKSSAAVSPLRAIAFNSMTPLVLRGGTPSLAMRSLEEFRLGGRNPSKEIASFQSIIQDMYSTSKDFSATAALTLRAAAMLDKLTGAAYTPDNGAQYPAGSFATSLKQTAQLIKANVGMEVSVVSLGGWDTHAGQGAAEGRMALLLKELAESLAAFQKDMGDGFKRVTIVAVSEFGRRAQENGSGGTDHGHGNVMFVLGGGVKGGKVFGAWPSLAAEKLYGPGDLAITTDFRDVLAEIVQKRLGNANLQAVFPGYQPRMLGIF